MKEKIPSWEQLTSLRTATVLKLGYFGVVLAPIFAYLILMINEIFSGVNLSLPKPMFFLFFGSVLLSIAHFLNEVLCPYIIKRYGSLDEYRTSLARLINNQDIIVNSHKETQERLIYNKVSEEFNSLADSEKKKISTALANGIKDILLDSEKKELPLVEYADIWKNNNESAWQVRLIISILYTCVAIIVMCLIIWHFINVLVATF